MTEHIFKEGQSVILIFESQGRIIDFYRRQVVKVHKTGRFVLNGDSKKQYKENGHSAGDDKWRMNHRYVVPYSADKWEELVKPRRVNAKILVIKGLLNPNTPECDIDEILSILKKNS